MIGIVKLTEIERTLLRALGTGASNKEIARNILKSELTIRNQLSALFRKINVKNRTQAVCWYREKAEMHSENFGTSVLLPAGLSSANNASLIDTNDFRQRGGR